MKLPKFSLFKNRSIGPESFESPFSSPKKIWGYILIMTVIIFFGVLVVGFYFFKPVYFEDYRNSAGIREEIEASINIDGLKNAVKKREDYLNKKIVIPRDPSA